MRRARRSSTRSTQPVDVARAQILKRNLKAIGLEVEIVEHPPALHLQKFGTPGEPFDLADVGVGTGQARDPSFLNFLFDGRTIGQPGYANFSYFDSPKYNRLLEEASRLTGAERYRAYGELDVQISRDAAPAIPVRGPNAGFVSARAGCVDHEPAPRPDRRLPQVTGRSQPRCSRALVVIPAAGTHGIKEGGTFRVAVGTGRFRRSTRRSPAARQLLAPACGSLMDYPAKPLPEGWPAAAGARRGRPDHLKCGRVYTFTIRKDARFSTAAVTARAFGRAIERILDLRCKGVTPRWTSRCPHRRRRRSGRKEKRSQRCQRQRGGC